MTTTPTSSPLLSSSSTELRGQKLGHMAAGALTAMFVIAVSAGSAAAADPAPAMDVTKLWTKNCQSCHGADGKGDTKAGKKAKVRDLTSPDVKAKLERDKIIIAIRDGVKEEGSDKFAMKPYSEKLSAAEIEALADKSMAFK